MFFLYFVPMLVCLMTGVVFFFKDYRNIPLGLLFIVGGLTPMMNIAFSIVGIIVLVMKASANKSK